MENRWLTDTSDIAPAVRIVEELLVNAVRKGASDIHGAPHGNGIHIHFRIDGLLVPYATFPFDITSPLVARLKILASLDSTEKRLPQDGKFSLMVDARSIDIRIATFPTIHGERFVLRILDKNMHLLSLNELGMNDDMLQTMQSLLAKRHGFFIVVGPTGSGKTTTLYALLNELIKRSLTIVTLEDPVEYTLEGIAQGQINNDIGFTFARGLKSLMRQDPDVILVGEIRDAETARIALNAALTGHLVFTTLHTADAVSAVARLMDMGIEPFLLNAALTAVIAQRLVPVLCKECAQCDEDAVDFAELLERYNLTEQSCYKAAGCTACEQRGTKGRTGLYELLVPTAAFKSAVAQKVDVLHLQDQANLDGMKQLDRHACEKVTHHLISFRELLQLGL